MKKRWQIIIVLIMITATVIVGSQKLSFSSNNMLRSPGYASPIETKLTANNFMKTVKSTSQVYIRSDGTIMINDKPFFPLGFYHEWFSTNKTQRLDDLENISAAGFNIIHPAISNNYESELDFLDEAQRLGVYVIPYYFHPKFNNQKFTDIVKKYANQPAILGWDIADDTDYSPNNYTPELVRELQEDTKAADKDCLTYISGFSEKIRNFFNSADVVGFQSYPISNDPNEKKPLRRSYYKMLAATTNEDGTRHNKTIIANLQTFPWENSRPPTFTEIYNMTYGALINGVKGILYYSYFLNGNQWKLPQNTDLWNGMKSLVAEIEKLTPVLLEGKLTKLDTYLDDLYATQWIYDNFVYVIVLSTSPAETIEVSLKIPAKATGPAQPLFPKRPSGMVFQDGKLSGSIKPGDVHVYQLSMR